MTYRHLLIIPCLILIGLIITAGSRGLADINVKSTQKSLLQWVNDVNTLNKAEWTIAYDRVSKAIDQDPLNPELLTLMANVQEWKIYLDKDDVENNHYLSLALKNYRTAAEIRPAWPYTWSHISLVKLRMGEVDQEFQQAIEIATKTGPWEPRVQQIIAEVGLSAWQRLNTGMREKIVRNINRGITIQPIPMLNILKKYGQLNMVCYQKKKNPFITNFCEKENGPLKNKK
ncbi:MAG: hypothetical protein ACI9XC_001890 [Gammaproteobacteria bacterium]|jgi:hypothetical protein